MKHILLLYLLLLTAINLPAQQKEFVYKNYTQEEGLPSNETYCIFEDSKKYIWIGTDNGLVRYNGDKFEQFELPDNVVFQIREDKKGRVWFFTHRGQLAYFENEKMHPYKYNDLILRRINRIHIKDVRIDEYDNILLSSTLDSNYVLSPHGNIKASTNSLGHADENTLFKINVLDKNTCFTEEKKDSVITTDSIDIRTFFGQKSTLFRMNCKPAHLMYFGSAVTSSDAIIFFVGKYIFKLSPNGKIISKEMTEPVLCIKYVDKNIWIGLKNGGMYRLNEQLEPEEPYPFLQGKSITAICKDYEGGFWVTTLENGLYYIRNPLVKHLQLSGIKQTDISRLLNVHDSILLFANSNGLYCYSNNTYRLVQQYQNYNVADLISKKDGNIYFFGGTYKITDHLNKANDPLVKNIFFLNTTAEVIFSGADTIIFAESTNIVRSHNSFEGSRGTGATGKPPYISQVKEIFNKTGKLFKDARGVVWIGANDGLYNSSFPYDTSVAFMPASVLLKKGITCIRQLENGTMVTGIRSSGIALISTTGPVINITEKEGLLSNKVRYMLQTGNQLWVATAKGISLIEFTSYQPLKYRVIPISKNDGFYNVTINQLIKFQTGIAAATSNGIYFIEQSSSFLEQKHIPIPFYINSLSYYKGDTTGITSITLPYSKNRLVIKYSAVSYNTYEKIQYLYRFNAKDTVWLSTTNTERLLESLEPGTYTFQIKAIIPEQQRFSSVQSLIITIEKPWWQNNWLRLLALVAISFAVYVYVTRRIRNVKADEKRKTDLNARLSELEQTALRSQMNPHFIFNCLTSIQQLIISGNKTDANEYLVKFSRLIRKTLEMSATPFISIREEKDYLEEYLFLEQLRLTGRFDYSIKADTSIDTDKIFIPNMMIQPVIENSVRHGIKALENRKGLITVTFKANAESMICTITDNGVGRSSTTSFSGEAFTKHKSYGMDIVRKRLETFSEFNVDKSGIEINDLYNNDSSPAGTEVILHLPLKKQSAL